MNSLAFPLSREKCSIVFSILNQAWAMHFSNIASEWGQAFDLVPPTPLLPPIAPSVYPESTDNHSHDKMNQVFPPSILHTASDQKLDGGKHLLMWETTCALWLH